MAGVYGYPFHAQPSAKQVTYINVPVAGPPGEPGKQGPIGETGPAGITPQLATAFIYTKTNQDVAPGAPVLWDQSSSFGGSILAISVHDAAAQIAIGGIYSV